MKKMKNLSLQNSKKIITKKYEESSRKIKDIKNQINGVSKKIATFENKVGSNELGRTEVKELKKRLRKMRRSIFWIRLLAWGQWGAFIGLNYFLTTVLFSISLALIISSLNSMFGINIISIASMQSPSFVQLVIGLVLLLVSLAYIMSNKGILYSQDIKWWLSYTITAEFSVLLLRKVSSWRMFSGSLLIVAIVSMMSLFINGTMRLFKVKVKDSKDRLTIVVAVIGTLVSIIALFVKS
ncbi:MULTISPECIES: hypothetical protein [unclassified Levilactobacillus]|uniref:hypothetical protein n=1 Tax=unclassified Levilactobacillus TaxID=2767918 RepID=UPI002FEFC2BE